MSNLSEIDWDFNVAGAWPLTIKIAAITLVSFLVAGVGVYYITIDQLNELEQLEQKESELKSSFEIKYMKADNLDDYRAQYKQIEVHLSDMMKQMPIEAEVANLLIDISQTGLASGLEFRLFKPSPAIRRDFYSELPIDIQVMGQYKQIAVFVSALASLPRIVTIHNISISPYDIKQEKQEKKGKKEPKAKTVGKGLLTMNAVIKTYNEVSGSGQSRRKRKK